MGTFEDELKKDSCKKTQMSLIKKILLIFFLLFPISNSWGAIITEVDDQVFDDGGSNSMSGIHFNDDGTKMFLLYQGGTHGDDHTYINQYNLSTPFDISTATYAGDSARCYLDYGDATGSGTNRVFDLEFSSDGLKLFTVYGSGSNIGGADRDGIYRFDLTSAFDISTCTFANTTTDLDSADLQDGSLAGDRLGATETIKQKGNRSQGISFNDDGTKVFISHKATDASGTGRILEYNLSTAYDVSTLTLNTNAGIQVGSGSNNYMTMTFGLDGKRIFVVDHNGYTVTQITIGSSFDLSSTSTTDGTVNLHTLTSSNVSQPRGIAFSTNGLKMFITVDSSKRGTEDVFEYDLPCPFNIIAGNCPSIAKNKDRTGIAIAQMEIAKRTIDHSTDTALNRLKWIRRNKDKQNLTNLNINFNFTNQKLASLTKVVKTSASKIKKTNEEKDIFYWSEGSFAIGRIGDTSIASTRKIDTDAVTLGADKFTNDNGIKGLAFRIGRNNIDVGNSGSNLDTDTYNITYYTTSPIKDDTKFLDTVIGFGSLNSDILTMLDGKKLIAQRTGNQLYGTLRIKDEIKKDNLTYIPSGRFDIGHTILQDYDEKGTGAVHVEEQHIRSKKIRAGLAAVEDLSDDDYTYKRHGKIEYVADIDRSSNFKYTYSGDTSSSFNDTLHSGSLHNISGEVGVDIVLPSSFSIFLIYERDQALGSGYTDKIHIAIGYLPNKETNYAFSIDGSDEFKSNYVLSKNINDYLIDFKLTNDLMSPKDYDEASFNLIRKF